jgi:hypothetical protein
MVDDLATTRYKDAQKLFDSFENFRTKRERWNKIRNRELDPDVGDLYHNVGLLFKTYRPQHEGNQFTAILDTASITIGARARSTKAEIKEDVQNWEEWLNHVFPALLSAGSQSPLLLSRSDRVCMGVGALKFDLHPEWMTFQASGTDARDLLKLTEERKLEIGLPFIVSAPNPLTLAWFTDELGDAVVVEQGMRGVNPIARIFKLGYKAGEWIDLAPTEAEYSPISSYTDQVKFTQISTRDEIHYYVENKKGRWPGAKLLRTYRNPWGRPPYLIIPARLQGGNRNPDDMYRPLIEGSLVMAEYDNFAETLVLLAGYLTAAPLYDLFLESGGLYIDPVTNLPIEIPLVAGKPTVKMMPAGAKLMQRTIQMGVDMDKFRARVAADMERFGFPTGLSGEAPEPRTPAWALAEKGEHGMIQVNPAINAERNALIEAAQMVGYCIKNSIKEEVPILTVIKDAEGADKDEIVRIDDKKIHECDITVGITIPSTSIQLAKEESDRKDVELGWFPLELYLEETKGVKDVAKTIRMIEEGTLHKALLPTLLQDVIDEINRERTAQGLPSIPPIVPEAAPPEAPPTEGWGTRGAGQVRVPGAGGAPPPAAAPPVGGMPAREELPV